MKSRRGTLLTGAEAVSWYRARGLLTYLIYLGKNDHFVLLNATTAGQLPTTGNFARFFKVTRPTQHVVDGQPFPTDGANLIGKRYNEWCVMGYGGCVR